MNNKLFSTELKVGILVLVGILILFYMSFRIGKYGLFREQGYELFVTFANASGLDVKTPVQIAGVAVGKIKEIVLDGYMAKATLTIKKSVKIPADSKAAVKSQGVLGDKFIEIIPGSGKTFLAKGGKIENVIQAPNFDEIFTNVSTAAKSFGDTMSEFKGLVGENERLNIKKSIENIQVVSGEFKDLVKGNKENIGRIVDNAHETLTGLKVIVKNVEDGKGTLGLLVKDDKLYKDAKDAVSTIKNITSDIEQGKGAIGKLVKDDELYADARDTVKNIKDITDGIKKGEGSLGKFAKDDKLYNETEKAVKKVQRAADGISEMTPVTILGTILGIFF
jgi:phospholipid/cholesterol/gamma-HCH transport system substrate-binding protein